MKKLNWERIAFVGILVFSLAIIIYTFEFKREGFHSDENWSLGFANSFYQAQVYEKDGYMDHMYEWTDTKVFFDYLAVNKGEQFRFDSIYQNVKADTTTPLYYYLVHFVSSFFPERFSFWFALIINLCSYVWLLCVLYLLAKELMKSKMLAIIVCAFYAFSPVATNSAMYLRVYILMAAICVSEFLVLHQINQANAATKKQFFFVFLMSLLCMLSHYYGYVLTFAWTVAFFCYWLVKKQYLLAIKYGIVQTLAVAVSFLLYPSAVKNMLQSTQLYDVEVPLSIEIKDCLTMLWEESTGIPFLLYDYVFWAILSIVVFCLIVLLLAIVFLFRNDEWMKSLMHKCRNMKLRMNAIYIILCFVILFTLFFVAKASNIHFMGVYADRYLFYLMPLTMLTFVGFLWGILSKVFHKKKKIAIGLLVGCLLLCGYSRYANDNKAYLFLRNTDAPQIEKLTKDANVIVVTSDLWHMVWYTSKLINAKQYFAILDRDVFADYKERIEAEEDAPSKDDHTPVYLIIESAHLFVDDDFKAIEEYYDYSVEDVAEHFTEFSWSDRLEFIQKENSFCGELVVYRLH